MGKKGVDLEVRCTLVAVAFDKKFDGGLINGNNVAPHDDRYALSFMVGRADKTPGLFTKIPKLAKECYVTVEEYYKHEFKYEIYDCLLEENNGNYRVLEVDGVEIIQAEGQNNSPLARD